MRCVRERCGAPCGAEMRCVRVGGVCYTAPCWHGVEQQTQLSHVLWHAVRVFGSSFKGQFFWFSAFFCA